MPTDLPSAVLWDMDGTLIDSEKLWTIALRELTELLGGRLSTQAREALVGSNMERTVSMLFEQAGRVPTQADIDKAGRWLTERTEALFHHGLVWKPGAQAALRAVRASGVPAALVTSTERVLTEVALDTIGREFFAVTICGDEVDGLNKPHPEPYLRAARLLGVDPAGCVAIEDSPTVTASAVAAGATVLVVPSEVAVPVGERRVLRESLVGVDIEFLAGLRRPSAA